MVVDLINLGKCLKKVREDRGATQEGAAEALGVHRTAIVQMEAGNRSISTLELAQLASFYERPIAEFFMEDLLPESPEDEVTVALHRVTDSFKGNPELQREVDRCFEICREGAELEKLLGKKVRSGPPFYSVPEPRNAMDAVRQGSHVASEERKRLGIGEVPLHGLADLLASQGVWVAGLSLPDNMSGLFLRHSSIGIVLLVNDDHPRPRKRFSLAHEYAHALLDRNRAAIVSTWDNAKDRTETRANSFAAALLMPEGGVRSYLNSLEKGIPSRQTQFVYSLANEGGVEVSERTQPGSQTIGYQDVASLARYFGVSYRAATFRLQGLNIINQAEREGLLEQEEFGNRYLRMLDFRQAIDSSEEKSQDDIANKELRSQVAYLAIEAFRRDEISKGKLLELSNVLGISGRELLLLAQSAL